MMVMMRGGGGEGIHAGADRWRGRPAGVKPPSPGTARGKGRHGHRDHRRV